jgi:hypothetical protein
MCLTATINETSIGTVMRGGKKICIVKDEFIMWNFRKGAVRATSPYKTSR